jgi:hypothetical protein
MYEDAMEAAAASQDTALAESLLRYFADEVDEHDRAPTFAAMLYICYELIPLGFFFFFLSL